MAIISGQHQHTKLNWKQNLIENGQECHWTVTLQKMVSQSIPSKGRNEQSQVCCIILWIWFAGFWEFCSFLLQLPQCFLECTHWSLSSSVDQTVHWCWNDLQKCSPCHHWPDHKNSKHWTFSWPSVILSCSPGQSNHFALTSDKPLLPQLVGPSFCVPLSACPTVHTGWQH